MFMWNCYEFLSEEQVVLKIPFSITELYSLYEIFCIIF